MTAWNVTAVLVTRGNVEMKRILESLPFRDILVWDNSERKDCKVYGRYAAIEQARHGVVYVQDDDCVLPPESIRALVDAYEPETVTANMPAPFRAHYTDSCLIGFGAVFDATLPQRAFDTWFRFMDGLAVTGEEGLSRAAFERCCDVVFTTLSRQQWLDVPYENLPWATGEDRMYRQPIHVPERALVLDLARRCRDVAGLPE